MSPVLRIGLILFSILTLIYAIWKIRKSQMRIEDSSFWIVLTLVTFILSLFPNLVIWGAGVIGVQEPANFIFLCFLFIILVKLFSMALKMSQLESRIIELTQELAVKETLLKEQNKKEAAEESAEP